MHALPKHTCSCSRRKFRRNTSKCQKICTALLRKQLFSPGSFCSPCDAHTLSRWRDKVPETALLKCTTFCLVVRDDGILTLVARCVSPRVIVIMDHKKISYCGSTTSAERKKQMQLTPVQGVLTGQTYMRKLAAVSKLRNVDTLTGVAPAFKYRPPNNNTIRILHR